MALEIQHGRSKWWYGRVEVNGKKYSRNMGVEVRGRVPPTLSKTGDIAFERSRAKAQAALEKFQADLKRRSTAEELIQTIHEIRTGARVGSIPLGEIEMHWQALLRRRPLSERYLRQAGARLHRFVEFVKKSNHAICEMAQVQSMVARSFLKAEEERGVAPKTYNNMLIFLRSVFHSLRKDAGLAENPFEGIPTREGETFFRHPFTVEELGVIVEKAKADPFIYRLIVTGMCTAMRLGDCCTLLRGSVDLEGGFITVKTSKTGEFVEIPIFPLLREVLVGALKESSTPAPHYVFPDLAARYRVTPEYLTNHVRRVFRAAGFFNAEDAKTEEERKTLRGEVSQLRKTGLRRASVRDFHSFRVTWVTLALSAGVPMEIVQKVTGHRTTSIVMKHYFQPGREDLRRTLAGRMPALLVGGEPKVEPLGWSAIRVKLEAMNCDNWSVVRDELLARFSPNKMEVVVEAEAISA
jgi:integrase